MPITPEDKAREVIDSLLEKAGWHVCNLNDANIHAHCGVVIRNFPLKSGHGFADYIFYVDGRAAGVIEAKKAGATLTGVEIQSDKYKHGLPDDLPAWYRPLPFCYQSTGVETRFTNGLDPEPRSRNVFSFHKPETLLELLTEDVSAEALQVAERFPIYNKPSTFYKRLQEMPPLIEEGLWSAQ
ncbi:MAG: type III restriction endonuclease subunit R, partial [Deltaproteobacteria bacterium]|nr:type III restriction endonuclease subunit R [Deltaproteobacteria bacterium]